MRKGFTFLELLIALAILGSTFTILLAAHTSASRMTSEARHRFTATALAREKMSAVEVEGLPHFGKDAGDFGEDFPEYRWELEAETVPNQPLKDLKEVNLRVLWNEGRSARSLQLAFFYMVREP
jgi:general secretion pathway protein I